MMSPEEIAAQNQAIIAATHRFAQQAANKRGHSWVWHRALWEGQTAHRLPIRAWWEEVSGATKGFAYALDLPADQLDWLADLLTLPSWGLGLFWVWYCAHPPYPDSALIISLFVAYPILRGMLAAILAWMHNRFLPTTWQEERQAVIYQRTFDRLLPDELREAAGQDGAAGSTPW